MTEADHVRRDAWSDGTIEEERDHPQPNRRRVAVWGSKPDSLSAYLDYGKKIESQEPRAGESEEEKEAREQADAKAKAQAEEEAKKVKDRAFDDAAADAALAIAANAETRIGNITGQRIQLTAFNIAISGGLLAYHFGSPSNGDQTQTLAISVTLVIAAVTFCLIQLILSKTELFFYHIASRSNYIARKHYRLSDPTWVADAFYQAKLNEWFDRHTFWPMAIANFAIPSLSAIALWTLQ